MKEQLTIIGSGAMALYFGSRLAGAGIEVQFLGSWTEGVRAIQQQGIRLAEGAGEQVFPARAYLDESELGPVRHALVLVKSWQTARAAGQLSRLLAPDGIALTLQNGLGNAETLQAALGPERSAQGVTTYGATLLGPGLVRPGGEGVVAVQRHPALAGLTASFQKAGLNVQEVADLSSLVWGKLVINVGINPLTALLGVPNGGLLESPAAVEVMGLAAREAAAVARKSGVRLDFDDPAGAAEAVAEATSRNSSSMLQDLRRGAPTEIEALCGEVTRRGKALNQPTPVNHLLYLLIKARLETRRTEDHENARHSR